MSFDFNKEKIWTTFITSIPWLMVFAGIALIILGFVPAEESTTTKVLNTIGTAILSSGVFAVILKTFQFVGVFKEELTKIVTNHEYIDKLSSQSKKELWKKITSAIHKDNFPSISDKIHEKIINDYFPTDQNFFFQDYRRNIKVKWDDPILRTVLTEETISVDIIPKSPDEAISHKFYYKSSVDDDAFKTTIELVKLDINGEDHSKKMKEHTSSENGVTKIKYKYKITLDGKEKYTLKRTIKKKFSLSADPYSRYYSATFISDSSIKVEVESEGLQAIFVESGTNKVFENRWDEELTDCGTSNSTIDKLYPELLFPRQGYVLHYQCSQD